MSKLEECLGIGILGIDKQRGNANGSYQLYRYVHHSGMIGHILMTEPTSHGNTGFHSIMI